MEKQRVLDFLNANPSFLAEHADALGLRLRDDKVRSFAQAQLAASQLKIDKMAGQLEIMLADSEANRITMQRLLALDVQLLRANTVGQVVQALYQTLQHDFGLHQFKLLLIAEPRNKARIPGEIKIDGGKVRATVAALEKPLLGTKISAEMRALLPAGSGVPESFLQLPVPVGGATGAVLLAADTDVNRFAADLPTEWIERMAEALGAALSRIMGYR
ncbi:DUF484 family protein [Uruburuella testudinis]|uniref:DUF484 family protein n=1 Tax=Uruburuella testudinis TaxID=1282863 RepID=A0ABY4DUW8_9NEIS|nr:DUF484 family protein [Uruburuella testudinis]UOO82832.1 DUF484 family protein [Uruburuella testudinis]